MMCITSWQCTAENRVGKVEHTAALHVYGKSSTFPILDIFRNFFLTLDEL